MQAAYQIEIREGKWIDVQSFIQPYVNGCYAYKPVRWVQLDDEDHFISDRLWKAFVQEGRVREVVTEQVAADAEAKAALVRDVIEQHADEPFEVVFTKRTDGRERRMLARYDRGRTLAFNPVERNLLPVIDLEIDDQRFVALEGVRELRVAGRRYTFASDQALQPA